MTKAEDQLSALARQAVQAGRELIEDILKDSRGTLSEPSLSEQARNSRVSGVIRGLRDEASAVRFLGDQNELLKKWALHHASNLEELALALETL